MSIRDRLISGVSLVGVVASLATVGVPAASATVPPAVMFGSFNGQPGMQSWQGKSDALGLIYVGWAQSTAEIQSQLMATWNAGEVPVVSWYLLDTNSHETTVGDAEIASGAEDSYLLPYLTMFKQFLVGPDGIYGTADDRRIYLRPDWEANGTWYGWSPAYTPSGESPPSFNQYKANVATFKAMWVHLHALFTGEGITSPDLLWVFSVGAPEAFYPYSNHIAEDIYPGDSYVDWVALDGYNFGSTGSGWQTPDQVFDNMVTRLQALAPNKPLGVTEVGSTTNGASPSTKAQWITAYFAWLRGTTGQNAKMTIWFNLDKTENGVFHDVAVYGGSAGDATYSYSGTTYNVYSEYAAAVSQDAWLVGSDPSNPRHITDAQFLGQ